MFLDLDSGADSAFTSLSALVVPRPIGWISTLSSDGTANLAPYSFFNGVGYNPPQVMFAATGNHDHGGLKDAVRDAQATGEFVVNLATWELREQMSASSVPAPSSVDEFEYAGLAKAPARLVKCPRVADSPVHLECLHIRSVELDCQDPNETNIVVFGQVIGVHIDDRVLTDGRVDFLKLRPIGRLGYMDYVEVNNAFTMQRPNWG
ncbi:MAG: flavin reductase family protein [Chloroflexi bacterium]|nr:flavin reductase family protein [Chloroflexota bacterium]